MACRHLPEFGQACNKNDPMALGVQYMKWAGISKAQEDTFWTNPTVRNLIKNDYKVLVTRRNTFNGKLHVQRHHHLCILACCPALGGFTYLHN